MLRVLDSRIKTAQENMERDAAFLKELGSDPILHLYDWKDPGGTYGYFIDPEKHLRSSSLVFAKRPTGGGIVFHIWDYAFSFLMPADHPLFSEKPLDNYQFVNGVVLEVMEDLFNLKNRTELIPASFPIAGTDCQNFCMARPTQYDVVYKGTKIAGAAQRKTKIGYLHQGTISLCSPNEKLLRDVLINQEDVVNAMKAYTFAPLGASCDPRTLSITRIEIGKRLTKSFQRRLS